MPRIMSKVTLQLGEFAPKLFGIEGIRLGRLVGRAKDLCARLGGWTNRIDRKLASTLSKKTDLQAGSSDEISNEQLWEEGPNNDGDHRDAVNTRAAITIRITIPVISNVPRITVCRRRTDNEPLRAINNKLPTAPTAADCGGVA